MDLKALNVHPVKSYFFVCLCYYKYSWYKCPFPEKINNKDFKSTLVECWNEWEERHNKQETAKEID